MVSSFSNPGFPPVHTHPPTFSAMVTANADSLHETLDALFAPYLAKIRRARELALGTEGDSAPTPMIAISDGGDSDPASMCSEVAESIEVRDQKPQNGDGIPLCIPSIIHDHSIPPLLSSSPLLRALVTSAVKPQSNDFAVATISLPESKRVIHASMMTTVLRQLRMHSFLDTTKTKPKVVPNSSFISANLEAKFPSLLTDNYSAYLKDKFGWVDWYLVGKFVKKNLCALTPFDEMSKRQNDDMFIQPLVHSIEVLHLDCLAIQLHYFDLNCYLGFEYGCTIALGRAFACSSGFSQKPMFGAFGSNLAQTSHFESPTQTSQVAFGGSIIGSSTPIGDICYCNGIRDKGGGFKFNKMQLKMAVAQIKLLRNKGQVVVKQMRRDIALLLQSGKNATARIWVKHVIREHNTLAANEFIELFCELVVSRLSIIAEQGEYPPGLKEGIASLIFASPRCSEISELIALTNVFEKKHGKDFVFAAVDVRPSCGVNCMLIDKLSIRIPMGEVKLKLLTEIAKEYHVEWDTSKSKHKLFKPPEELIQGRNFGSTTSMPVHSVQPHSVKTNKPNISSSCRTSGGGERRTSSGGEKGHMQFVDSASAAKAAATSASDAMAAAQVAAYWANRDCNKDIDIVSLKEIKEASPLSLTVSLRSTHVGRFQSLDQFLSREYRISLTDNLESKVKLRDEDYSQLFYEVHKFDDGISEFNNMVSVIQAMVTQSDVLKLKFDEGSTMSKFWLLNLGGSERQAKTEVQGESPMEAQNINKFLSALRDMISALPRIKALDRLGHVDEENAKAVSLLENVLDLSDAIEDEVKRVENLFRGIFAGNIFGLGYAQLAEVLSKYSMSFSVSCQNLVPRPLVINDFDAAMVVCVISECKHSGALDHKKCVHTYCKRGGFYTNILVKNALIGIIIGLAMNGESVGALEMFSQMEASSDVKSTFRSELFTCSHGGFVDKGFHHFGAITEIYKLSPRIEHYRCMGDLLGRANMLNVVEIFIRDTPIEPDLVIWKSLLFAYRTYENIVLAELVAKRIEVFESKGAFIKLLQDKHLSVRLAACRSLCLPSEDSSSSKGEFINLLPICWDLCLKLIKEVQESDSKMAWEESANECLIRIQLVVL